MKKVFVFGVLCSVIVFILMHRKHKSFELVVSKLSPVVYLKLDEPHPIFDGVNDSVAIYEPENVVITGHTHDNSNNNYSWGYVKSFQCEMKKREFHRMFLWRKINGLYRLFTLR